eukprot:GAFH01001087.1.p1 GENE.GAFH01001087.1~~GAFH01001087.1.p1  ORF type:complete len:553 (-),score=132.25 GAFH01001087.1:277-1935(-)
MATRTVPNLAAVPNENADIQSGKPHLMARQSAIPFRDRSNQLPSSALTAGKPLRSLDQVTQVEVQQQPQQPSLLPQPRLAVQQPDVQAIRRRRIDESVASAPVPPRPLASASAQRPTVSSVAPFLPNAASMLPPQAHQAHHVPAESLERMALTPDRVRLADEGISSLDPVEYNDIDCSDARNPQAVTEYVNEIYQFLRESEQSRDCLVTTDYIAHQPEVNERMRAALIDWILDVHYGFKMSPDSLFLSVNLIDRFLSKRQVSASKLLLLGVTSLFLAAKFEETPAISVLDFVSISGEQCSRKAIIKMESLILDTLKYTMSVPTTLTFLKRYAKAADATNQIGMLSRFITELALHDYYVSTHYLPSMVSAAAISLALRVVKRPAWTPTLIHYSGYQEHQLTECVHDLARTVLKLQFISIRAVYEKYNSLRYLSVAQLCLHEATEQFPAIALEVAAHYQRNPEPLEAALDLPDLNAIRDQDALAYQEEQQRIQQQQRIQMAAQQQQHHQRAAPQAAPAVAPPMAPAPPLPGATPPGPPPPYPAAADDPRGRPRA